MKKILLFLSAGMLMVTTAFAQSGSCGENLTWSLSDGTLTISGQGEMGHYSYTTQPWYSYRSSIKKVEIGNEVTSIGYCAFYDCSSLTSIDIPSGMIGIGDEAFLRCSSLTSIDIPSGVMRIGNGTFYYCSSLTSINIPSSVTSIGNYAFGYCDRLTSIDIPIEVTSIEDNAFRRCSGFTSITIPSGVRSIGEWTFGGCGSLTSIINLSATPQFISSNVFYDVDISQITLHVPPGSKGLYESAPVWEDFYIVEDATTDVEVVSPDNDIRVYPYPAAGIVYLSQAADVKVYNLHGAWLLQTFGTQVDLSGYPKGVYLLQVNGKTVKVINGN